jgi:hypothetical protein
VLYPGGEIWVRKGYVLVKDKEIPNLDIARRALDGIDSKLVEAALRKVVFDTRDMPAPPAEVNAMYWQWVIAGKNHDRVALLVKSDMKRVEGNMNALSKGVQLRSFHTIEDAETWLSKASPRRP